jgi:hypothetical protein
MQENWLPIIGYEGLYEISNTGNVKALPKQYVSGKYYNVIKVTSEVFLKFHINKAGYVQVTLCKNGKTKLFRVHRLVGMHFIPNPESKPQVNHKYGIKTDNRASELEWSTSKENNIHAHNTGLNGGGERIGTAKLSNNTVAKIKMLWGTKLYKKSLLATMFNISQSAVGRVINGQTWKQIA